MAYLAIARKWRPQRFEEIVGQTHVTQTLQNAIRLNRVHHAFLFTGARGVGKTTAARILAKALNCEQGPTPEPCNTCRSCKEITAGIANDVQEIDAASNTGVENIRELRDKLRYLPASGRYRIYIVDEIHMLSTSAFNAFLKTLEEPPAHVVFIFATTDPQRLPDTIVSRCQRFDFKRIPIKLLSEKLGEIAEAEGIEISQSALLMIAREAEGSMRDAESLLDQVLSATADRVDEQVVANVLGLFDRQLLFDCLEGALSGNPDRSIEVVDRVHTFGFDIQPFARDLLEMVRHLNVIKVASRPERLMDVSAEELARLKEMASQSPPDVLSRQFDLLLKGYDEVSHSGAPRLALEMTLLKMARTRPAQPMDRLLSRLDDLERLLKRSGKTLVARREGGAERPANRMEGRGVPREPEARGGGDSVAEPKREVEKGASRPGGQAAGGEPGSEPATKPGLKPGRVSARGGKPEEATAAKGGGGRAKDADTRVAEDGETGQRVPGQPDSPDGRAVRNGGGDPGDMGGRSWLGFVAHWVALRDPPVRPVVVKQARPVREEPGRIVLGGSKFECQRIQRELGHPRVKSMLEQYYGRPVQVECIQLGKGDVAGPSYQMKREAHANARREALQQQLMKDPNVVAAARIFGVDPGKVELRIESS